MNARIGSIVVATDEVIDDGDQVALSGDQGRVLDVQRDGRDVALMVLWENAPRVTTSYLGLDCVLLAAA
jgi:hypothetical protein